ISYPLLNKGGSIYSRILPIKSFCFYVKGVSIRQNGKLKYMASRGVSLVQSIHNSNFIIHKINIMLTKVLCIYYNCFNTSINSSSVGLSKNLLTNLLT